MKADSAFAKVWIWHCFFFSHFNFWITELKGFTPRGYCSSLTCMCTPPQGLLKWIRKCFWGTGHVSREVADSGHNPRHCIWSFTECAWNSGAVTQGRTKNHCNACGERLNGWPKILNRHKTDKHDYGYFFTLLVESIHAFSKIEAAMTRRLVMPWERWFDSSKYDGDIILSPQRSSTIFKSWNINFVEVIL